jgi:hypothetical protein
MAVLTEGEVMIDFVVEDVINELYTRIGEVLAVNFKNHPADYEAWIYKPMANRVKAAIERGNRIQAILKG